MRFYCAGLELLYKESVEAAIGVNINRIMTRRARTHIGYVLVLLASAAMAQTSSVVGTAAAAGSTAMAGTAQAQGSGVPSTQATPGSPESQGTRSPAQESADSQTQRPTTGMESANGGANQFQQFVADSLGYSLPMFGYNLFAQVPSTFAQADRIPVTDEYVIGPGDEMVIRAWGQLDLDARVPVDRGGDIYLAKVGTLHVAGLKYQQLADYLKSAIGRIYKNFDLTVNLGQLRSIQVFVVGQARRPGVYTVSSLSTLVNALFACGGPSPTGSMRHIQLKRDNTVVTEFDIYDLLLNGDKSKDVVLKPGDIIFIPSVGSLVAVDGSVNVPAIYELKSSDPLDEVLRLSGGLTNVASEQTASIERINEHSTRRVDQFPLDQASLAHLIRDGDLVKIYSISPKFENAVTLRGNVFRSGRYPWHQGMRVHDLIPSRQALITRDYWVHQNSAASNRSVSGLPEVNWVYALVTRMGSNDLSNRLLPFNLGKAVDDPNSDDNLELETGDIITVYSQADVRVPERQQSKYVYLEGEVRAAGVYRVEPGETLRELVTRAGGLTPQSYLFGSEFTRDSTRVEQQARLDEVTEQLRRETEHNASLLAVKASDNNSLGAKLQLQQSNLRNMKQLKANGRMVLNLRPADNSVDALPELVLQNGDHFYVPNRSASISVMGEVVTPSTLVYEPEKRIQYYLRESGGATRFADQGRMFVLRANGSTVSKSSASEMWGGRFDNLKLMPGDAIVIPQKLPTIGVKDELKDWGQILSQFGLGAAAVHVLTQ